MFCPKCGTQNPESGKFCRACGTDLSPVADALEGKSKKFSLGSWEMKPIAPIAPMQLWDAKGKSVSWESAIGKFFTALAFFAVTIALANSVMGRSWWFWMLIPAFGTLGSGLAQIYQLKKAEAEKKLSTAHQAEANHAFATTANAASLPPTQTQYVEPRKSIYDTGEFAVPPSVTENTTRHLEINSEGETMTLPKNK